MSVKAETNKERNCLLHGNGSLKNFLADGHIILLGSSEVSWDVKLHFVGICILIFVDFNLDKSNPNPQEAFTFLGCH